MSKQINMSIGDDLYNKTKQVFDQNCVPYNTAIKMFLASVARTKSIPVDTTITNIDESKSSKNSNSGLEVWSEDDSQTVITVLQGTDDTEHELAAQGLRDYDQYRAEHSINSVNFYLDGYRNRSATFDLDSLDRFENDVIEELGSPWLTEAKLTGETRDPVVSFNRINEFVKGQSETMTQLVNFICGLVTNHELKKIYLVGCNKDLDRLVSQTIAKIVHRRVDFDLVASNHFANGDGYPTVIEGSKRGKFTTSNYVLKHWK